jgi:hypothetical protein
MWFHYECSRGSCQHHELGGYVMKVGHRIAAAVLSAVLLGILDLGLVAAPAEAAGATRVTGVVTCINGGVVGVWIQGETSTSGWASWTMPQIAGGLSKAAFSYTLNRGGRYQVHVGCGGNSKNWGVDAKSVYVTGSGKSFNCNNIQWWLAKLGYSALRAIFGVGVDLTWGVPYGTCRAS